MGGGAARECQSQILGTGWSWGAAEQGLWGRAQVQAGRGYLWPLDRSLQDPMPCEFSEDPEQSCRQWVSALPHEPRLCKDLHGTSFRGSRNISDPESMRVLGLVPP